jgi:arsenate reductase
MTKIIIYHNPSCSKSRQALDLIKSKGLKPKIIHYLQKRPSKNEIRDILNKLNINPIDLVRKGEQAYKDQTESKKTLDDHEIITMLHEFPKTIERPIIIKNHKAIIARPPERVLDFI